MVYAYSAARVGGGGGGFQRTLRTLRRPSNVFCVDSFSSLIVCENGLKFGTEESSVVKTKYKISKMTTQLGGIQRRKRKGEIDVVNVCVCGGDVLWSWNARLSLVVTKAPAWRMRARAYGTSSALQLDTPSASTWTSYPASIKSSADWSTHTCD